MTNTTMQEMTDEQRIDEIRGFLRCDFSACNPEVATFPGYTLFVIPPLSDGDAPSVCFFDDKDLLRLSSYIDRFEAGPGCSFWDDQVQRDVIEYGYSREVAFFCLILSLVPNPGPVKVKTIEDYIQSTKKEKIKFELTTTNVHTRWPCHICGGHTDKCEVLCETKSGPFDNYTRICENCLKERNFDERLKKEVQEVRALADKLETMVGRIEAPTFEQWEEAERKAEASYLDMDW
jgi:hypothetical protein